MNNPLYGADYFQYCLSCSKNKIDAAFLYLWWKLAVLLLRILLKEGRLKEDGGSIRRKEQRQYLVTMTTFTIT